MAPEPNRPGVLRSLVTSVWIEVVGGSLNCAPTNTLTAKSPAPPTRGWLWHAAQELASGPEVRMNPILFSSVRKVGFESPVAVGRPAPSPRLNLTSNNACPSLNICFLLSTEWAAKTWLGNTVTFGGSQFCCATTITPQK